MSRKQNITETVSLDKQHVDCGTHSQWARPCRPVILGAVIIDGGMTQVKANRPKHLSVGTDHSVAMTGDGLFTTGH